MNNTEIEKTIKLAKNNIQKAKDELSEAKGQKKALLSTLNKDFGLNNLMEAEEAVSKLNKEINVLSERLEEKYNELKEKYNFI